ncbi:hypothetical protein CCACVL1_16966 [Corchorus capsularis]|uniref:BZIP domain-containing protein n=1 Tax=Corchorus capsularis TaxID=210143 RepID=A0A1R3HUM2_COCAP|nr:hypothetical protein CCACVL1_16966 [Corchorus capsularis]
MGSHLNFKNFGEVAPTMEDNGSKPLGNFPLARQSSIYSLTFDELQSTFGGLGKDFGSMNMDELLKNISSAEETQGLMTASVAAGEGVPYVFGRGRKCSAALEKVVERRQRRMIKNRESAARSRARKQAYTLELEAEVAKLKEMNQELQKKQEEIMEMQKNQMLETLNRPWGGKRQCLRRTLTGPW